MYFIFFSYEWIVYLYIVNEQIHEFRLKHFVFQLKRFMFQIKRFMFQLNHFNWTEIFTVWRRHFEWNAQRFPMRRCSQWGLLFKPSPRNLFAVTEIECGGKFTFYRKFSGLGEFGELHEGFGGRGSPSYASRYGEVRQSSHKEKGWISINSYENGQNCQIFALCSNSLLRYGGITSLIFRRLAALEPPKHGGQRRSGRGQKLTFFLLQNCLYSKG